MEGFIHRPARAHPVPVRFGHVLIQGSKLLQTLDKRPTITTLSLNGFVIPGIPGTDAAF
jgi:hypothetical protein